MLTWMKRLLAGSAMALAIGATSVMVASPAFADEAKPVAAAAAAVVAAPALIPNKADTAWLLVCTALVILMTLPGLALFYGGLTRSKNILSVLVQCMFVFALITVLWSLYGYSFAFTEGGAFIGGLDRLFLQGITPDSVAATFSKGIVIPEYVFMAFQAAFATITCCLIIGSFAERAKFSAIVLFVILWFTFSYLPIAHMVWFWPGPDDIKDAASLEAITARAGWLWQKGVLDFAGGTVVHINAAIAGLVGSFVVGKRLGYGKEAMKPHNLVFVMIGASLLWFGWFGFNAGSALEANGSAVLAFVNTLLATAAAVLGWSFAEWITKGKPSMLGAASGCVAGLVAITPAAGFVGPMGALVIGVLAGVVCLWGVSGLKKMLGSDDSLDVFGVHGVGGILGALLTGVFADPALGGTGIWDYVANAAAPDYSIVSQLWIQSQGVIVTLIWSGVVSYIAFKLVDIVVGLRVKEDEEREGLDISSHGESAYES
ncbi:ammonium transporter [Polynucleobacter duraquae]|uniref:Ammonium transporter n=1 Tax=Polynucleobacter duraquae TaxID=1835254 RepID=A0A0E3V1M0_9BURK|nr:ammonium transporter [Polynucleobacter duraquae]AKD26274.1 ammonium transporter [Polynucleobacter duraquae]